MDAGFGKGFSEDVGDDDESLVAGFMAVHLVEEFELVEVDDEDGKGGVAIGSGEGAVELGAECPVIVERGEGILFEHGDESIVALFERSRHVVKDPLEESDFVFAVGAERLGPLTRLEGFGGGDESFQWAGDSGSKYDAKDEGSNASDGGNEREGIPEWEEGVGRRAEGGHGDELDVLPFDVGELVGAADVGLAADLELFEVVGSEVEVVDGESGGDNVSIDDKGDFTANGLGDALEKIGVDPFAHEDDRFEIAMNHDRDGGGQGCPFIVGDETAPGFAVLGLDEGRKFGDVFASLEGRGVRGADDFAEIVGHGDPVCAEDLFLFVKVLGDRLFVGPVDVFGTGPVSEEGVGGEKAPLGLGEVFGDGGFCPGSELVGVGTDLGLDDLAKDEEHSADDPYEQHQG